MCNRGNVQENKGF